MMVMLIASVLCLLTVIGIIIEYEETLEKEHQNELDEEAEWLNKIVDDINFDKDLKSAELFIWYDMWSDGRRYD